MRKEDDVLEATLRVRITKEMMSTLQSYAEKDRREWSDWLRILFEDYITTRQEKEQSLLKVAEQQDKYKVKKTKKAG